MEMQKRESEQESQDTVMRDQKRVAKRRVHLW
jgi:hypothetical protein